MYRGFLRGNIMQLAYLSSIFYNKYTRADYPEMLHKENRPYVCLTIEIEGRKYAIPIRHHITHKYAFITIGERGLDYTKAVLIEDESYIAGDIPKIDTIEWRKIQTSGRAILVGFGSYLKEYRHALAHKEHLRNDNILKYSALQYFDIS